MNGAPKLSYVSTDFVQSTPEPDGIGSGGGGETPHAASATAISALRHERIADLRVAEVSARIDAAALQYAGDEVLRQESDAVRIERAGREVDRLRLDVVGGGAERLAAFDAGTHHDRRRHGPVILAHVRVELRRARKFGEAHDDGVVDHLRAG